MALTRGEIEGKRGDYSDFEKWLCSMPFLGQLEMRGMFPDTRELGIRSEGICPDWSELGGEEGAVEEGERGVEKLIIDPFDPGQLQPAGLDFTVGNTIFASDTLMKISHPGELEKFRKFELKDGEEFLLEPSRDGENVYYVLSKERVLLPGDLELVFDAKSTTGRLGCMCHHVADSGMLRLAPMPVIAAVIPYAFPIQITAGKSRLLQGIIRYGETGFMSREEILANPNEIYVERKGRKVELRDLLCADGMKLSFSTKKVYVSRNRAEIPGKINIDAVGMYKKDDFWQEVEGDGKITMEPRRLYLFGTLENVKLGNVCARLSREHAEMLAGLWGHFAGFIWPGFSGEVTLECWSDKKRVIHEGELAGVLDFDMLSEKKMIENLRGYHGSYQNQKAPRLPKMFL